MIWGKWAAGGRLSIGLIGRQNLVLVNPNILRMTVPLAVVRCPKLGPIIDHGQVPFARRLTDCLLLCFHLSRSREPGPNGQKERRSNRISLQ